MTRRPPPGRRPAPRGDAGGSYSRRRPGSTALPRIILAAFGVIGAGLFALILSVYTSFTSGLPNVADVENFDLVEGSTVVSADGTELATFAIEDRREISLEEIPQVMIDAQVAAEDQTFWTNPCVDFRSIVRAFLQNFEAGQTVSGASTICQQLVRMRLFTADHLAAVYVDLRGLAAIAISGLRPTRMSCGRTRDPFSNDTAPRNDITNALAGVS